MFMNILYIPYLCLKEPKKDLELTKLKVTFLLCLI